MNVLITGGDSFISRFVARRFYKEGHQITLISSINQRKPNNFREKCTYYYIKDGAGEKKEKIFKSNQFDVVIYVEDLLEKEEYKRFEELIGLINLSTKYNVKHFVFIQQHDLETNDIYTLLSKYLIESSKKIENEIGIGCTVLKSGIVYGPEATRLELDSEIISHIDKNRLGYKMFKPSKPIEQYNYIDDLVDVTYKVVAHRHLGVYDLNRVILGWEPKYSLEKGMEKTVSWYKNHEKFWEIDKEEEISALKKFAVFLPYGENIFLFLITFLIAFHTKDNLLRYSVFPLDFNLIYIFLISSIYGIRQSIIAMPLACFSYIFIYLNVNPDISGIIYNQGHIIQLLIYLIVGSVTAYGVDNKKRKIKNLNTDLVIAREEQDFIEDVCQKAITIKEELQEQILNTDNSLGKIYNLSKGLSSLLVEDVYHGAISTLEELLKTKSIFIYVTNESQTYLRLMARSKMHKQEIRTSFKINDFPSLKHLFETKEVIVNYELNPLLPMMMAPVVYKNQIKAVVFVEDIPFKNLTLYYENFFRVAIGLIENAIKQALTYEDAICDKKYIIGSKIIRREYFREMIKSKQKAKVKFGISYSILKVKDNGLNINELSTKIQECIRNTDYIGMGEENTVYIMLSHINVQQSDIIIKRLKEKGISIEQLEGVSA